MKPTLHITYLSLVDLVSYLFSPNHPCWKVPTAPSGK